MSGDQKVLFSQSRLGSEANLHNLGLANLSDDSSAAVPGVTAAGNQPRPAGSTGRIPLTAVLSNPVTFELFKDAVVQHHNAENIAFVMDVQLYRQSETSVRRRVIALDIVQTFVATDAPHSLNVQSDVRTAVLEQVKREQFHANLFHAMYTEIYQLLERNDYARFLTSRQFAVVQLVLKLSEALISNSSDTGNGQEASLVDHRSRIVSAFAQ